MYLHKQKGVTMKNRMKPLPVRFSKDVMDRCKLIHDKTCYGANSASDIARNAMEIGLSMIEENNPIKNVNDHEGDSHLQEDLLK